MNTTPQNQHTGPGMSPDEARAALEQASRTSAVAPRDRTVYAVGTALFGVVLGAFVPLTRALDMDNGPSYLDGHLCRSGDRHRDLADPRRP